jgi:hypothetical protein
MIINNNYSPTMDMRFAKDLLFFELGILPQLDAFVPIDGSKRVQGRGFPHERDG